MRFLLDVLPQNDPCEKGQRQLPETGVQVIQLDGVDDLGFRDVDVHDAEVLFQAMPEKLATQVDEYPELLVRNLQGDQMMLGRAGLEILCCDARECRQVVDDRFSNEYVVVHKRFSLVLATATDQRYSG